MVSVLAKPVPEDPWRLVLQVLQRLGSFLKVLVVEEVLFSRCENEICSAIHAFENAVLELRHGLFPVINLTTCWPGGLDQRPPGPLPWF